MKWDTEEEEGALGVHSHSDWIDLIDDMEHFFETEPGLFIFADDKSNVKYIGKCEDCLIYKEIFKAKVLNKADGATKLKIIYTRDLKSTTILHRTLIDKYEPPNNEMW